MSRRRQLSEEERALWTGFVRSITPLDRAAGAAQSPASGEAEAARPVGRRAAAPAERSPPLVPLGRRLRQRVARGRAPIDARIDLHGKTQVEAHAALLRFLRGAQADGAKIALVVTGKGSPQGPEHAAPGAGERGVLRRQVPIWLSLPEFRVFVVGFEDAHGGHGGAGALYVRLRRRR